MAILVKSKTPEADRNYWGTQWECFADAQELHGRKLVLDVCADPLTAKCERYIARPELLDELLDYRSRDRIREGLAASSSLCVGLDAFNTAWDADWYCNPPFDLKAQFIAHARHYQATGRPGMMLLPYEPLTTWWRRLLAEDVIIYEPDGRYQFYERDGATRKSGANFGCALIAFPTMKVGASPRIPFVRGIGSKRAA